MLLLCSINLLLAKMAAILVSLVIAQFLLLTSLQFIKNTTVLLQAGLPCTTLPRSATANLQKVRSHQRDTSVTCASLLDTTFMIAPRSAKLQNSLTVHSGWEEGTYPAGTGVGVGKCEGGRKVGVRVGSGHYVVYRRQFPKHIRSIYTADLETGFKVLV